MEAALDLSRATIRIKSETQETPVTSPTSGDHSMMATNNVFSSQMYRSLLPVPILDNPGLALAAAFATHGFLSPVSAPPYASFFNPPVASPKGTPGGDTLTPPASAAGFTNGTPTPEPVSLLPSASLALSTLHRRRRPAAYHRNRSNEEQSSPDSGQPPAKRAKSSGTVPDEKKDDQYWERRRKNNEAAKRSRDARRVKEEEIVVRAAYLEQENLKLKAQVAVLKNETAKLHFMLLNHVQSSA